MAIEAATKDPRFPPLTVNELKDLELEVSVLTPMKPVPGPDAIVVGRDGVLMRLGDRGAVFLPQVAPQQGWNRTQMLEQLSEKAGLPAGAWRDPRAKFSVFQADVFSESSLK
jgi:AmmeMemoRadiSam system protein A